MTHPVCRRYPFDISVHFTALPAGYHAAATVDALPPARHDDDHVIHHGAAVSLGHWYFFPAIEPALAFGRAARMSLDVHGYAVYRAARESTYCDIHRTDETVLLICGGRIDRTGQEVDDLKRFVQAVKEHPWSSHWHPPTGYLTDYRAGQVERTTRPSLPL